MLFYMISSVIMMNIVYKRKTLYVHLEENVDELLASKIEDRVNSIMGLYAIDNLVICPMNGGTEYLRGFESRFNASHKNKMIIK